MSILSFLGSIFTPASKLIDDLHTSSEEKLKLKNELVILENQMTSKILEYEKSLMEAQSKVIMSEAQGQSWMQRNWRPITMLTFLALVVCDSFGLLEFRLASQAWTLLQIGLGGYVIGRSVEKSAPSIVKAISNK